MLVLWHCGCIGSKHLFSTPLISQLLFDGVWIQLSVTPSHMIPSFCQSDILFCKLNFPRRGPTKKLFLANVRVDSSVSNPFLRLFIFHFQSESEPFYLHPPGSEHDVSRRRRQEEREGRTRESVRVSTKSRSGGSVRPSQSQSKDTGTRRQRVSSSDGVRFTDLSSDPLHRSKQGSEGQGRYYSGEFSYRGAKEKERTRGGQRRYESKERRSVRSHSVDKEEEKGHRRASNKENRHSVHYGRRNGTAEGKKRKDVLQV